MQTIRATARLLIASWLRVFQPIGLLVLGATLVTGVVSESPGPAALMLLVLGFLFAGIATVHEDGLPDQPGRNGTLSPARPPLTLRGMQLDGGACLDFSIGLFSCLSLLSLAGIVAVRPLFDGLVAGTASTDAIIAVTLVSGSLGWLWMAGAIVWRRRVRRTLGLSAPGPAGLVRGTLDAFRTSARNLPELLLVVFAVALTAHAPLFAILGVTVGLAESAPLLPYLGLFIVAGALPLTLAPWLALFLAIARIDATRIARTADASADPSPAVPGAAANGPTRPTPRVK